MLFMFLVTHVFLVCILWKFCQILALWDTINMLLFFGMGVVYVQYSVRQYGKHEIIFVHVFVVSLFAS